MLHPDGGKADTISLADLRAAAGIGKSTLYQSFAVVVGDTDRPISGERRPNATRLGPLRAGAGPGRVRVGRNAGMDQYGFFANDRRGLPA